MMAKKGTGVPDLGVREVHARTDMERSEAPELDRAVQARIGDQLRAMYTELLEQPVPDRFRELIAKLDEAETEKQGNSR